MKYLFLFLFWFFLLACGESGDSPAESAKCQALKFYDLVMMKGLSCEALDGARSCNLESELKSLYENPSKLKVSKVDMEEVMAISAKEIKRLKNRGPRGICVSSDSELECSHKIWSKVYKSLKRRYSCR